MNKNGESKSNVTFSIKPPGPPKVWDVIELKIKTRETPIKFSIQEIPEDRYPELIELMCSDFIADEPLCKSLNGVSDPDCVDTFRHFWEEVVKQGLCVGAFTENPNGGKPILAGANVLALSFKDEKFDMGEIKSEKAKTILRVVIDFTKTANVFEKYGVEKYISAFGLSVRPSYRGASLGGHILNARTAIGREYGISVTSTAFTSPISQKLAERCGFETLAEKNYGDMLDEAGKPFFPGLETKKLKIMAKKLY